MGQVRRANWRGVRMKAPNGKEVANHTVSESCVSDREVRGEALTRVRAGWAIEPRNRANERGADAVCPGGRQHRCNRYRKNALGLARSKNPCMHSRTSHGTREILCLSAGNGTAERVGKSKDRSQR